MMPEARVRVWMLLALLAAARRTEANCNIIPSAAPAFRASLATTDRPFARPGDWVKLTLDPACHGSSPGFPVEDAPVVTIVFTPSGGPRHVVVLSRACGRVDLAACRAEPDVADAVCLATEEAGRPDALQVIDRRTLRFRFPDTDALLPATRGVCPGLGEGTPAHLGQAGPGPDRLPGAGARRARGRPGRPVSGHDRARVGRRSGPRMRRA